MKTIEYIKQHYESQTLDGRDLHRLIQFIPESELKDFGFELNPEYVGKHEHKEFTKENILVQLKNDVEFGFTKALNRRGISSSLMFGVVRMWNWVLEEGLENWDEDNYAMYGLPLFRATAVKYGFDNPIGEDEGSESHYGEETEYDE